MVAKLADVFWNLPALVSYRGGTELPVTISAVNLTDTLHEYMLKIRSFNIRGEQIADDTFTVDGLAWFELDTGERIDADGIIILEDSDVTLGVYLVERETKEEVDSIFAWLEAY